MASIPLSATNIHFLKGIPFNSDYKNTRWFDSKQQQTNYFLSKPRTHSMNRATFQRIEGRHYVDVNNHIDNLWETNYMMFQNAQYNTKWFYAFVTKVEYVNIHVTRIHFEVDVLQTWLFDMKFKPSYVVREHRPLWYSNGRPYINTIDEGLNYGDLYDTVDVQQVRPTGSYKWLVVVVKQPFSENKPKPRIVGTPQPLSYYVLPFDDYDSQPIVQFASNGSATKVASVRKFLEAIYQMEEAMNNIVNIYVTDYIGIPCDVEDGIIHLQDNHLQIEVDVSAIQNNETGELLTYLRIVNMYQFFTQKVNLGNVYDGFIEQDESKLMMFPYCVIVLTDFKGNHAVYRPEFIDGDLEITVKGSIGHSNYVSYGIEKYNYRAQSQSLTMQQVSNEYALINNNPSNVPILNDLLSAFLQGNRNTIENQKNSVLFNAVANMFGGLTAGVGALAKRNPVGLVASGIGSLQGMGNSVLDMQNIHAKLKDIDNVPPNLVKQGSNTGYDYGYRYNGIFVIKKQIKPEYRKILGDFFNAFGYKTHQIKIPNFHTRRYWNYVQTESCNILGDFNNEHLQKLKSVFDNGITLWHTDDVGNYSLRNEVI